MSRPGVRHDPVTVQVAESQSNYSPVGSPTMRSNGPSHKEPAMITSTWKIGWQTPSLMIACYVLAVAIALVHLFLFRHIHGREANGPNRVAPQSYVTTASTILANAFGFSLRATLATAFVQYLWHLLRVSTMKVSTIELLFTIRTNLFMLFRPAVLRATPALCALAILMWGLQVATSFPPGAITISTAEKISHEIVTIPTYNASFMGNASGLEANQYSLANLWPADIGGGFSAKYTQATKRNLLLPRVSFPVLVKGEAFTTPSPCGVNCSYVMEFEGPYFKCVSSTSTFSSDNLTFEIYHGEMQDLRDASFSPTKYNGTYTRSNFNSTTLTPLSKNIGTSMTLVRRDNLFCLPGRAKFTVNNTFLNNVQKRTIITEPIERLVNFELNTRNSMVIVPGFTSTQGYGYGTAPANWSTAALNFYRDMNHMTIIHGMMYFLAGGVHSSSFVREDLKDLDGGSTPRPYLTPAEKNATVSHDVVWGPREYTGDLGESLGIYNSIIDTTRFNTNFGHFTPAEPANMAFNITEDILNEYLLNYTMSMMIAFGTWNTTANATRFETVNVYDFSSPLNLILPYFLSLTLAIPFLLLGGVALFKNGVSAIDSSFMQIIATSTGSAVLDKAAAGGCLGGDESMPQELKDLKIRFGEIIDREEPGRLKRAGFGVDGEVTPLRKGDSYGVARWI